MSELFKAKQLLNVGEKPLPPLLLGPEPTIYEGHVIDVVKTLPADSVHVTCTSIPYFRCRAYGTPPIVWEGPDSAGCEHEWGEALPPARGRWGDMATLSDKQKSNRGSEGMVEALERDGGQFCQKCRCWRGELGQEPTSGLFTQHVVDVFREVRRVLHPSGLLFLNLADSRAGSGKGRNKDGTHSSKHGDKQASNKGTTEGVMTKGQIERTARSLLGIPDRVKEALVADGWIHVSSMILPKGNPMTTSARGPRWVNHHVKVKKSSIEGSGKQAEVGGTYAGFNERWKAQQYAQGNVPGENASRTYRGGSGGIGKGVAPEDIDGQPAEWVRCPGCKQCTPHNGKVLRFGGGRPTDAYEMFYIFAKTPRWFFNTEAARKGRPAESSVGRSERYKSAIEKYGSPARPESKQHEDGIDQTHGYAGIASGRSPDAYNASGGNSLNWLRLDEVINRPLVSVRPDLTPEEQVELFTQLPEELLDYFLIQEPDGNPDVLFWKPAPTALKHYAIFPPFIPTYALAAGTAPKVCSKCLWPYAPVIEGDTHDEDSEDDLEWQQSCGGDAEGNYNGVAQKDYESHQAQDASAVKARILAGMKKRTIVDWWALCTCEAPPARPTALDPFVGSGTTLKVARQMGINSIGIDVKKEYVAIARKRVGLEAVEG